MTASVEDHFPMEPIPAPPAQFNTNNEDEVNAHSESKFSKKVQNLYNFAQCNELKRGKKSILEGQ